MFIRDEGAQPALGGFFLCPAVGVTPFVEDENFKVSVAGNGNSCGDAFEEAFVISYKGQMEKLLNLHKGFTPTPQDLFLLVNSPDARYTEHAPKELPSQENQDSGSAFDPAEHSVQKVDTELQRRESAVKKWVCYCPPVLVTGLWAQGCFPTKPSRHLSGPGAIRIQNTSDEPAEADDMKADRNEL